MPTFILTQRLRWLGCCLALIGLSRMICAAHPDLIEQIVQVSEQISERGISAERLRWRADLFRRHAQFDEALADLASAEHLQTNTSPLFLDRTRVLFDAGQTSAAFAQVEKFLSTEPGDAEGLIYRARCQARLGHGEKAVVDYSAAIAGCYSPGPDLFLERAQQQAKLGKFDEAVRGLDEAITNSPVATPLQLTAIDYDRRRGAFDCALARVDGLIARYPVKEPWLTLRAEILEQAGRNKEAGRTFQQVLTGIESYPPIRRNLDLTKQLESRARQGLARTQTQTTSAAKL